MAALVRDAFHNKSNETGTLEAAWPQREPLDTSDLIPNSAGADN